MPENLDYSQGTDKTRTASRKFIETEAKIENLKYFLNSMKEFSTFNDTDNQLSIREKAKITGIQREMTKISTLVFDERKENKLVDIFNVILSSINEVRNRGNSLIILM